MQKPNKKMTRDHHLLFRVHVGIGSAQTPHIFAANEPALPQQPDGVPIDNVIPHHYLVHLHSLNAKNIVFLFFCYYLMVLVVFFLGPGHASKWSQASPSPPSLPCQCSASTSGPPRPHLLQQPVHQPCCSQASKGASETLKGQSEPQKSYVYKHV